MKKLLLFLFTTLIITGYAQKQYNCYHVQEFLWNPKTLMYDLPVERGELSTFKIDDQNKALVQSFQDGTSTSVPIKSESYNKEQNTYLYKVMSPSNGYTYLYRINLSSLVMEVMLEKDGQEILLKKYLYRA